MTSVSLAWSGINRSRLLSLSGTDRSKDATRRYPAFLTESLLDVAQRAEALDCFPARARPDLGRLELRALAERLAAKPRLSLQLAKTAIHRSLGASLDEMLDYEVEAQRACFRSAEAREGVRAFVEKREPDFSLPSRTRSEE